jgi:hypothetical protein
MCRNLIYFQIKFIKKIIGEKNTKLNSGYNCFWLLLA